MFPKEQALRPPRRSRDRLAALQVWLEAPVGNTGGLADGRGVWLVTLGVWVATLGVWLATLGVWLVGQGSGWQLLGSS